MDMSNQYNEDKLHVYNNSILVGDSIPEGNKKTYRKGDVIINIGEKCEQEPIYICIEGGSPGKWTAVQGMRVSQDVPVVEDVKVDTVTFISDLSKLISEYSKLPAHDGFLDVDLSNTYMTIATIDDPDFAAAKKTVSLNGVELAKTSKLSIGNGNFIQFDQIIDNGNEIQLSMFTLAVAGDSDIAISADGFEDVELNVALENATEVESIEVIKGAKWQNEKYNVKKIAKNEYEIEIIEPLTPAGWTPDLNGGTMWLLFEFMDAKGKNMLVDGDQMIYMEIRDGENVSSGVDEIKQFAAEDGSKGPREFMYINVLNDHAYELEYIFTLSNGSCKPQKLLLHIPANIAK
jgi:hypothetical protein